MFLRLAFAFCALWVGTAFAADPTPTSSYLSAPWSAKQTRVSRILGPVAADVLSVHDGDTMSVVTYPWPGLEIFTQIRVRGIDTPEIGSHARCDLEAKQAEAAHQFTLAFITGKRITIGDLEPDKYGDRVVASVYANGMNLTTEILKHPDLAYAYNGDTKKAWCPQ